MASIYKRKSDKGRKGSAWRFAYVDADGIRRTAKGCSDKRVTEEMAARVEAEVARVRMGLVSKQDLAHKKSESLSLASHLTDWHRDIVAKGKTTRHADQYRERAGKLVVLIRGTAWTAIQPGRKPKAQAEAQATIAAALGKARLSDLTPERIQAGLASLLAVGLSPQSVNHFRAAIRAFLRWAWDRGRLKDNPFRGVDGYNAATDIRHPRRSLTDSEMAKLVQSASQEPERFGLDGSTRAMAYRVASLTGFRVAELRALTVESFRLSGPEPSIYLAASATKNRRPVDQPIPKTLADDLVIWLQGRPAGAIVFPLHREMAKAIRADLEAAGVPYATDEGIADFHSLRARYVSSLVKSGATIKEVQALARHASPATTLRHYAKVSIRDLRGALESLPNHQQEQPKSLAKTGTDSSSAVAAHLQRARVSKGLRLSSSVETSAPEDDEGGSEDDSEPPDTGGFRRPLSSIVVPTAERGGFEPPRQVSPPNGLANRFHNDVKSIQAKGLRNPLLPLTAHMQRAEEIDPDLSRTIRAWPNLSPAIRAGIVALVLASETDKGKGRS